VYVDDEHLVDMFRMTGFVRIDQYGPASMRARDERVLAGLEEFGAFGPIVFFSRKKNK
jgi:hypothetical protein